MRSIGEPIEHGRLELRDGGQELTGIDADGDGRAVEAYAADNDLAVGALARAVQRDCEDTIYVLAARRRQAFDFAGR